MKILRKALLPLGAAALALTAGAPPVAGGTDEALTLVPAGAVSVGVVRLDDLRSSPFAAKLFTEMDELTVDGEAAKFVEETGLRPKQDLDLMVVAGMAPSRGSGSGVSVGLVLFEGRFDPTRLAAALEARGAVRKRTAYGEYQLVGGKEGNGERAAVAVVSRRLLIAGSEAAVVSALEDREAGGSGFLRGEGLGRHLHRVPGDVSAWAMVDAARVPIGGRGARGRGHGDAADALVGAMKSVSLFVFHATSRGDSVLFSATGLAEDGETRELLEDALRGLVAAWRLAVHEKSPDLVPVLRRFQIERDGEGVSISGMLPASLIRRMVPEDRTAR